MGRRGIFALSGGGADNAVIDFRFVRLYRTEKESVEGVVGAAFGVDRADRVEGSPGYGALASMSFILPMRVAAVQ